MDQDETYDYWYLLDVLVYVQRKQIPYTLELDVMPILLMDERPVEVA